MRQRVKHKNPGLDRGAERMEDAGGNKLPFRSRMTRFATFPIRLCRMLTILAMTAIGAGCDSRSSSGTSPVPPRRVTVLASVYPLADMAKRIGGAQVDVQWLAESGQHPEE